ncbi:hypothetical protein ES703_00034 [subsurface metagenome]
MTLVKIIEWQKRAGSLSRWAAECFEDAGCEVEITHDWRDTSGPADIIYTPVPGLENRGVPLVTQLEGYGGVSIMPGSKPSPKVRETFNNSAKVLLADPNIYRELKRCGIDQASIMLPNPVPNITITPRDSPKFTVFCPQGTWKIKKPERIIEAAKIVGKAEPKIRFVMPVGSKRVWREPLEWLELDNMEFLPSLPYDKMLEQYAKADIVAPFSAAEILPWTVFESFIAGKPTVVDVIGKVQSVNREYVREMVSWFGVPSRIFHERWEGKYASGEGDHYLHAGSSEELAKLILELYSDEKRRLQLGLNAQKWIDAYDWKPKDKGKKILEIMGKL